VRSFLLIAGLVAVAARALAAQASPRPPRARLPLQLMPDTLAICRLPAESGLPSWASQQGSFLTISRTREELSITAVQSTVPADARCERDYRAVRVRGPLATNLVGILLSMAEPLADAGVSIFAISTYDTDYVLVQSRDLQRALDALRRAGHHFVPLATEDSN
jgi:hypothetical protein